MAINIRDALKRTFDLASLRHEAKKDLNAHEWRQYQIIKKSFNDQRRDLQTQFEVHYDRRIADERQRLIEQAGSKGKSLKHRWFGHDPFNKEAIHRQAHIRVLSRHHRQMTDIDEREKEALQTLLDRCEKRIALRDKPKTDFNRTADRRQEKNRRQSDRSSMSKPQSRPVRQLTFQRD